MRIRCFALILLLAASAAQASPTPAADEPQEGRRYALVVGVQNYEGAGLGNLRYCDNDAAGLADVLTQRGYRVTLMTRPEYKTRDRDDLLPTADNIRDHVKAVLRNRKPADTVLLAFAGHGEQLKQDGKMYFCPAKCDLKKLDTLVSLDWVYEQMKAPDKEHAAGAKVLIVDACRDHPQPGRTTVNSEELESVTRPELPDPPGGTVALFSCSKGETAFESDRLKHGFLFHFVIEGLQGKAAGKDGRIKWTDLTKHVNDELSDAVAKEFGPNVVQTPEVRGESHGLVLAQVDAAPSVADAASAATPDDAKKDEIKYDVDGLDMINYGGGFGVKFKEAKLDQKKGGDALITITLEFTKDLTVPVVHTLDRLVGGKGYNVRGHPYILKCYFIDGDGVAFSKQPLGKIDGALTGKEGDAFRVSQTATADVLAKTKRISIALEPSK